VKRFQYRGHRGCTLADLLAAEILHIDAGLLADRIGLPRADIDS